AYTHTLTHTHTHNMYTHTHTHTIYTHTHTHTHNIHTHTHTHTHHTHPHKQYAHTDTHRHSFASVCDPVVCESSAGSGGSSRCLCKFIAQHVCFSLCSAIMEPCCHESYASSLNLLI